MKPEEIQRAEVILTQLGIINIEDNTIHVKKKTGLRIMRLFDYIKGLKITDNEEEMLMGAVMLYILERAGGAMMKDDLRVASMYLYSLCMLILKRFGGKYPS